MKKSLSLCIAAVALVALGWFASANTACAQPATYTGIVQAIGCDNPGCFQGAECMAIRTDGRVARTPIFNNGILYVFVFTCGQGGFEAGYWQFNAMNGNACCTASGWWPPVPYYCSCTPGDHILPYKWNICNQHWPCY
jgi:hypothetical protein